MALIRCKECGREISDSANMCPHCGCATEYGAKSAQVKGLSVGAAVAGVLSLIGLILFITGLGAVLEGVDDYGSFARWMARDDEAIGGVIKLAVGLGMALGGAIFLFKVKGTAQYIAREVAYATEAEQTESVQADYSNCAEGTWICSCGRVNAVYVTSCTCGVKKRDAIPPKVVTKAIDPESFSHNPVAVKTWTCSCGRVHPDYLTSCVCGVSKRDARFSKDHGGATENSIWICGNCGNKNNAAYRFCGHCGNPK